MRIALALLVAMVLMRPEISRAEQTYTYGHINNVTFVSDFIMIQMDSGLPGNCTGTSYGWMKIPATNGPMVAFVLGLWMRGDAASVNVVVYTDGVLGDGYCRISQMDPAG